MIHIWNQLNNIKYGINGQYQEYKQVIDISVMIQTMKKNMLKKTQIDWTRMHLPLMMPYPCAAVTIIVYRGYLPRGVSAWGVCLRGSLLGEGF